MAPGIACNGNLFRLTTRGEVLTLDHDRSFANLLAARGFDVYLYHPGCTERIHNRYVARFCRESIHYGKPFRTSPAFNFEEMVMQEVPAVVDFVSQDSGDRSISWVGYSQGGMLAYAYLALTNDGRIQNLVTIGSPVSLTQVLTRMFGYTNLLSHALGLEERTLLGTVGENLVPLTRLIALFPGWLLRFNVLAPYLYNPTNMRSKTVKTFFGKVAEPIPAALEHSFTHFIFNGFSSKELSVDFLAGMRRIREAERNYLFIFGQMDALGTPDSVRLAHETLSPGDASNLVGVRGAGHVDLIVGRKARETVWEPTANWLTEK